MRPRVHLKGIQAFEAAARHLSFVEAARELNVTPAAVAQLVRSLESGLGGALFERSRSGASRLKLTRAAEAAISGVTRGLDEIEAAMRRARDEIRPRGITVTASSAIATRWLVPHLDRFAARHPDIEIRLDVTDRVLDLARHEADLGIRCGLGPWPGTDAIKLMDEEVIAVCAPALGQDGGGVGTAHNSRNDLSWLCRQVPIHDTAPAQAAVFPSWSSWLAAAGQSATFVSPGLHINATASVIQAALNGQGVALARHALVAHDLAAGRLVRCLAWHSMPFAWSYFAVVAHKARRQPQVELFVDWLQTHWQADYRLRR